MKLRLSTVVVVAALGTGGYIAVKTLGGGKAATATVDVPARTSSSGHRTEIAPPPRPSELDQVAELLAKKDGETALVYTEDLFRRFGPDRVNRSKVRWAEDLDAHHTHALILAAGKAVERKNDKRLKEIAALVRQLPNSELTRKAQKLLETRLKQRGIAPLTSGAGTAKIASSGPGRAAPKEYGDVSTEHFVARFKGYADERIAWSATRALERAYFGVGDKLGIRPDKKITVVIYTGGEYAKKVGAPDWSTGLYDGNIHVREGDLQNQADRLDDLLFHEYTHALIHHGEVHAKVPTWVNEGLADNMEPSWSETKSLSQLRHLNRVLPMSALSGRFIGIKDKKTVSAAYLQSALMVKRLLDKQGASGMRTLFDHLRGGDAFDAAFKKVYFKTTAAFLEEWRSSL